MLNQNQLSVHFGKNFSYLRINYFFFLQLTSTASSIKKFCKRSQLIIIVSNSVEFIFFKLFILKLKISDFGANFQRYFLGLSGFDFIRLVLEKKRRVLLWVSRGSERSSDEITTVIRPNSAGVYCHLRNFNSESS